MADNKSEEAVFNDLFHKAVNSSKSNTDETSKNSKASASSSENSETVFHNVSSSDKKSQNKSSESVEKSSSSTSPTGFDLNSLDLTDKMKGKTSKVVSNDNKPSHKLNPRQEALAHDVYKGSRTSRRRRYYQHRKQIPGFSTLPLSGIMHWSPLKHHYVLNHSVNAIAQGKRIVNKLRLNFRRCQVRLPVALVEALRMHFLQLGEFTPDQRRHFYNHDVVLMALLPQFSHREQIALVDAFDNSSRVLHKIYDIETNDVANVSNRKLLESINAKLDTNQKTIMKTREYQHNFFQRLRIVILAIFRLFGYLFSYHFGFNSQKDLANLRNVRTSSDKEAAYKEVLNSDYIDEVLDAAHSAGESESKREATILQTKRQSKR